MSRIFILIYSWHNYEILSLQFKDETFLFIRLKFFSDLITNEN